MARRDTATADVLEQMILPALRYGGYAYCVRVNIGDRFGGGKHIVDAIAGLENQRYLISMKWQQVSGTTEQKIPFEVICLAEAIERGTYERAYLVLGGEGWRLRQFYINGGLVKYLHGIERVQIVTLEGFVAIANRGRL